MYQNYNSTLNPLEKHFRTHEVISKRTNTLAYIAAIALGAFVGILAYRWIKINMDEENDFEFLEKTE